MVDTSTYVQRTRNRKPEIKERGWGKTIQFWFSKTSKLLWYNITFQINENRETRFREHLCSIKADFLFFHSVTWVNGNNQKQKYVLKNLPILGNIGVYVPFLQNFPKRSCSSFSKAGKSFLKTGRLCDDLLWDSIMIPLKFHITMAFTILQRESNLRIWLLKPSINT